MNRFAPGTGQWTGQSQLYVLRDPITKEVRYVGLSKNAANREKQWRDVNNVSKQCPPMRRWYHKALSRGRVKFEVVELGSEFDEQDLIENMFKEGTFSSTPHTTDDFKRND